MPFPCALYVHLKVHLSVCLIENFKSWPYNIAVDMKNVCSTFTFYSLTCKLQSSSPPLPLLRHDHQQSVTGLRYQQVYQRRVVRPGERPLALFHWPVPGGGHQRGLLLVLLCSCLLWPVVPQWPGPGLRLASLWQGAAQGI